MKNELKEQRRLFLNHLFYEKAMEKHDKYMNKWFPSDLVVCPKCGEEVRKPLLEQHQQSEECW